MYDMSHLKCDFYGAKANFFFALLSVLIRIDFKIPIELQVSYVNYYTTTT